MAIKSSTCIAALAAFLLSAPASAAVYSGGAADNGVDLDTHVQLAQKRPDDAPGGGRGGGSGAATAPSGGGPPGAGRAGRGPDAGMRGSGEVRGNRAERRELRQDRREERRETRQERREDRREARQDRREERREDRREARDDRRDRVIVDRDRDRRWRDGDRWWRDRDWRDRRKWRRGVLVIGGYDVWYDPAPTYIVVRYRSDAAWRRAMARCFEDFRSFNPRTGRYVTYGGESKLCPYLRPFVR